MGNVMEPCHIPVLLDEVLEWLQPEGDKVYVDGNLGLGGHSEALLQQGVRLLAFDWDQEALALAAKGLAPWQQQLTLLHHNFAEMAEVLGQFAIPAVDGILLDLGLSSYQLDLSHRGFSFQGSQPLDMRMDGRQPLSAADIVNQSSAEELADIFYFFGEERQARPIAAAIVEARVKAPVTTTDQLVRLIERAVPRRFHPKKIHVATRTFQALRIAVNHELDNLVKVLDDGPGLLKPGGRMAVISFHSLEDRLVKNKFKQDKRLQVLTGKPLKPTVEECERNPRARSARLRVAQRRIEEKRL